MELDIVYFFSDNVALAKADALAEFVTRRMRSTKACWHCMILQLDDDDDDDDEDDDDDDDDDDGFRV